MMRRLMRIVEAAQAPGILDNPRFKAWFGNSQVVDQKGQPLVVYHGAPDTRFIWKHGFQTRAEQAGMPEVSVRGFFFTLDHRVARTYADPHRAWDYQNAEEGVIDVYLKMENPKRVDGKGERWRSTESTIAAAHAEGHDGVIITNTQDNFNSGNNGTKNTTTVYVVFDAKQIKAIRNNGQFDPSSPKIDEDR